MGKALLRVTRSNTIHMFTVNSSLFWPNPFFLRFPLSILPLCSCSPLLTLHLSQAALMGGTTMVLALVLPEQHCSLLDAYEKCRALADAKACCDYALHIGVTWWGPKVRTCVDTSSTTNH